jgi:hypothetical protein
VVEVLHFMGGEDSPRRVLCPWRAHRLASTLPAIARATAVCFLRCECLIGRGVGRPRDPSHRWGARCSSHGCPAVFRGSQQVCRRGARTLCFQGCRDLTSTWHPCSYRYSSSIYLSIYLSICSYQYFTRTTRELLPLPARNGRHG